MFTEPSKTCPKCTKSLPLYKFAKNRCTKDGLQAYCKSCSKIVRKKGKLRKPPATKVCATCKANLPSSEFWKNKSQRDGLQSYCKPCNKVMHAAYRNDPVVKDRLALSNWVWRQDNIERVREASRLRCARYRERHKERLKLRMQAYRRTKKYQWLRRLIQKPAEAIAY